MDSKIAEIAMRIRVMREILGITIEEMAQKTGKTAAEYARLEDGEEDFAVTFLNKCADIFGVDVIELLTGERPKLNIYTIVRRDKGLPIERRSGFEYLHKAHLFRSKLSEPLYVTAPYEEGTEDGPISMSTHKGQEFDFVLKGSLKVEVDGHTTILNEGDSIYYDSSYPHGMIAVGGQDCTFLAIVIHGGSGEKQEIR
ncbi:DNA-binding transcriptional repressor PuuR [Anaerotruncus sp. 2789STDY5834896]|nr:DNA-binding transcriptional repressor PuuR [uncultured Anaerotruncus sp.]